MHRKSVANRMLAVVFVLFLLALAVKHWYRDSFAVQLWYVTMEAALIGGIADWFSVAALFGKPLGFPWHTELIPRNRDRLIKALANMVEQDLLSEKAIRQRIRSLSLVDLFIDWVDRRGGKEFIIEITGRYRAGFWQQSKAARFFEERIREEVKVYPLAPQLHTILKRLLIQKKDEEMIAGILKEGILAFDMPETQEAIYRYLDRLTKKRTKSLFEKAVFWIGEQTDSINLKDAAAALCSEASQQLTVLLDSDHELRVWLREKLLDAVDKLDQDEGWMGAVEGGKNAVCEQLRLQEALIALDGKSEANENPLWDWLERQMARYWETFKADDQVHIWFEARAKYVLYRLLKREHPLVGHIVRAVLGQFSNQDLNRFVQEKAGEDLEWIRVNGSVVGGLVGMVLYLFFQLLYQPYLLPAFKNWGTGMGL